ncbi:amidohydrolase family protein [Streptosporangium sp. NPDC023825]|uniref:amidohydrolase family protein n=1 Tax=Streptosporangium sp. NPDC023825 TaxID=3154909 RepID=UPI0034249B07
MPSTLADVSGCPGPGLTWRNSQIFGVPPGEGPPCPGAAGTPRPRGGGPGHGQGPVPALPRDRFHETFGPERIVFGTDSCDFPWGYITQYAEEQVRVMDELNLSLDDRRPILAGNAARLLGLDLPGVATSGKDAA